MKDKRLCNEIERSTRVRMSAPKDFVWLSKRIEAAMKTVVGVNTLKRIWEVDGYEGVKPRRDTLNILSRFIGYNSYDEFCMLVGGVSSDRILVPYIDTKTLAAGELIDIMWYPNRVLRVEHLGGSHFVVRHSENSKLSVGDEFDCRLIVRGEPLFMTRLIHGSAAPVAYIAGKQMGVQFERVEK